MSDRNEVTIVVLVMTAAAAVLVAPVLGRLGASGLAEAAMWLAALSGVAAFGVAGAVTWRAAREPRDGSDRHTRDARHPSEEAR